MKSTQQPIARQTYNSSELTAAYPPVFHNAKKTKLYRHVCPEGTRHNGTLSVTRWPAAELPAAWLATDFRTDLECRADYYGYEPPAGSDPCVEWYVNFSHYDVFCAYGASVFAQDEIQVAEHPILGSLREALASGGSNAYTVENGSPTPILIIGAERRCSTEFIGTA